MSEETTERLVQKALSAPSLLDDPQIAELWRGHVRTMFGLPPELLLPGMGDKVYLEFKRSCPLCGYADQRCHCWEDDA